MGEIRDIYRGRIVHLTAEHVVLPNGHAMELEIVRHPGAAAIAALDASGAVTLLRQYRHAAGGYLWEVPAGKLDGGEAPHVCAARELREEAGVEIEPGAFVGMHLDRYGGEDEDTPILNLVWEASIVSGELEPADDVSELRWFPRDGLPPDDELAFRWLAPALREWAAQDGR